MMLLKDRRFWFVPPVLIAALVLVFAPMLKRPPQKQPLSERPVKARVIQAGRLAMAPKAIGFGATQPVRRWEAVAEVSGRVVEVDDRLKSGKIVARGEALLSIDDTTYRLALTQAQTQLQALEVKYTATKRSLELEEKTLALLTKETERKRKLRTQGSVSASVLEAAERELLKAQISVQNLTNTLALTEAEQAVQATRLADAERDLANTRLLAPFDVRIAEVKINQAQYANKGQLLFTADGIDAVEIEARFPIGKLRPLIAGKRPQADEEDATDEIPAVDKVPGAVHLHALVRLRTPTHVVEWPARVDRVTGVVDPQTQTIGVVVVVDEPYKQASPGQRPALVRNTFVEVELRKKAKGKPLVIPSSALHEGKLYIADEESRLQIRPVKTLFSQDGVTAIGAGLEEGETLVVSDLVPAVQGMLLEPVEDEKAVKRLKMAVAGAKPGSGAGKAGSGQGAKP